MTKPSMADLLFEARLLKEVPRSGYAFLGAGRESVAEHAFMAAFIGLTMAHMEPGVDGERLVAMCLLHDLPEARIGDLNHVQKLYVDAGEEKAVHDTAAGLPFGETYAALIEEFNRGETREARLARDADQLALLVDLKALIDTGYESPKSWLPRLRSRLATETGRSLGDQIVSAHKDDWWLKNIIDRKRETQ